MSSVTWIRLAGGLRLAVAPETSVTGAVPVDTRVARDIPSWQVPEHLAARTLLRGLLAEYLGADAATIPIARQPGGRPYLPDRPHLGISLSHAGGQVAAAVGVGSGIGIDVQPPVPAPPALLRRCCTPPARAELAAMAENERRLEFAWIWTVQEACVKATGAGLSGRPWTIPVRPGQREGEWRGVRWRSLRATSTVPLSLAYTGRSPC